MRVMAGGVWGIFGFMLMAADHMRRVERKIDGCSDGVDERDPRIRIISR